MLCWRSSLLSAILHTISIARTLLPAQDGLKFIRVARQFQTDPWPDVVRDTDQHPLYPALIAAAEPIVALFAGRGPDTWRIAAQAVAALASLALLFPLYSLARSLFDERIACMAVAIFALLPIPAEVGHDTLSDSLGLLATLTCLRSVRSRLRTGSGRIALAAGTAAGIGYLARPDVILAPLALGLTWLFTMLADWTYARPSPHPSCRHSGSRSSSRSGPMPWSKARFPRSSRLRHAASLGQQQIMVRPVPLWLPKGLDDPRWDFSAKEEGDRLTIRSSRKALEWIVIEWWDELCCGFAVMAVWGLVRQRHPRPVPGLRSRRRGRTQRRVIAVFAAVFLMALVRHSTSLGYVSGRHTLPLVMISVPWAAAGTSSASAGWA